MASRIKALVTGAGAAATGIAATAMAVASRRRTADPYVGEPLGDLSPDKTSTVAADDGTPLAVREILPADGGEPEITLIGVHGFALSSASWYFQRQDIAALTLPRVRQVYYDHRGHGGSGATTQDTGTIEQLAEDLHAVIRAVAPDGPVVLLGHSMGGMAIIALAEQQPDLFADRVRGVCLITTAAGDVGRRGAPRRLLARYSPIGLGARPIGGLAGWQPSLVEFVRAAGGQLTRQAVRRLAFGEQRVPESLLEFLLAELAATPVRELVNFIATLGEHDRYVALAALKNTQLQVIGAESDVITPISHSEQIVAELPDAELVRVPKAGHMVQFEQPELVNSHLIDLLQRAVDVAEPAADDGRPRRNVLRRWFG